ncbi:hypothetical protein K9J90_001036 [Listeria innocua]|uniref:hypothetical protein n=1 Tax=Listeria innocua TaxID=1642 RepID=UPI0010EB93AF|nr:hypothetical protein [Listeria innocua]EAE1298318.1 hypothetical protein [Listeria monocytogenes]EDO1152291.1 hypothetical protein [Listeria innocua]EIB7809820.1 hypothetical protein [Listeria innocua]EIB7898217.1 hypothetical protein [Listeria innocua]EJH3233609.1 hypothetical protein [Listeria innocua]
MKKPFDVSSFLERAKKLGIEVEENVSEEEAGLFAYSKSSQKLKKVNINELFACDSVEVSNIHFNELIESISINFKGVIDESCSGDTGKMSIKIKKIISKVENNKIKLTDSIQKNYFETMADLNMSNKLFEDKILFFSEDVIKKSNVISHAA